MFIPIGCLSQAGKGTQVQHLDVREACEEQLSIHTSHATEPYAPTICGAILIPLS